MTRKKKAVEKKQTVSDDSSSLRSEETSSSLSAQVAEKLVVNEDMKDLVLEEDEFPDNLVSGFSVAVDKLNDKRSWVRLKALKYAYEAVRNDYRPELLENTVETLVYTLLKGPFHRTIDEERRLSCHLLASVVLTMGECSSSEYIWEHCGPILRTLIKRGLKGSLEAIACVGMVGSTDLEDIWSLMGDLSGYFLSSDTGLAAEALRSWSLLACSLPTADLYRLLCSHITPLSIFRRLFLSFTIANEQNLASAQSVALISELFQQESFSDASSSSSQEEVDVVEDAKVQQKVRSSNGSSKGIHSITELMQQLHQFRCQGAETLVEENKRTPKKQRSLRKAIIRALEGEVDSQHYQLANGEEILFDNWVDTLRIQSFRVIFQSGWKKHLESNVFIRQVLSLGMPVTPVPDSELRLTREEKRLYRSPNSVMEKKRTIQRQKKRAHRIRECEVLQQGGN